jgi:hypothetical protein
MSALHSSDDDGKEIRHDPSTSFSSPLPPRSLGTIMASIEIATKDAEFERTAQAILDSQNALIAHSNRTQQLKDRKALLRSLVISRPLL